MRKTLTILSLFTIAAVAGISMGSLTLPARQPRGSDTPLATKQHGYIQINSVTADDTVLDINTSTWDAIDGTLASDVQFTMIPPEWNRVELSFYGYGDGTGVGNPDNTTFTFTVYAARPGGGAKVVYTGTGTMGKMRLSALPTSPNTQLWDGNADPNYTWADTMASSGNGDEWADPVVLSGAGGNDGIATCTFDFDGYWGLWVAITDMTAQLVTSVTCVASGW